MLRRGAPRVHGRREPRAGRRGFREGLARERGAASVRVDTHPGNVPMQRLLGRCGYVRCGIILIGHAEGATPERVAFEKLV